MEAQHVELFLTPIYAPLPATVLNLCPFTVTNPNSEFNSSQSSGILSSG